MCKFEIVSIINKTLIMTRMHIDVPVPDCSQIK